MNRSDQALDKGGSRVLDTSLPSVRDPDRQGCQEPHLKGLLLVTNRSRGGL